MIVAIFPLVVAILGALVFALAGNAQAKELGRGAYWVGLFFVVSALAARAIRF